MKKVTLIILMILAICFSATYYVDPADGGSDAGTQANPWQDLDSCAVNCVAGDSCLCKGTQTLTGAIQLNHAYGSGTDGYIHYVGTANDWSIDGTRFLLDGNGAATNCVDNIGGDYLFFANVRFTGATGSNIDATTDGDNLVFINCIIDSAGSHGIEDNNTSANCLFLQCGIIGNTTNGMENFGSGTYVVGCSVIGNGGVGIEINDFSSSNLIAGCLIHDNGNATRHVSTGAGTLFLNNVFDGTNSTTDSAVVLINSQITFIGNRFTNMTCGIDYNGRVGILAYNYFSNCTRDTLACEDVQEFILDGSNTSTYGASADGYVDAANDTFNLANDAALRRSALPLIVEIP